MLYVAWGGALAFIASLAYLVHFYAVQLGATSGSLTARRVLFDTAIFSAFALHHSVFARSGVKRWITRLLPSPLERSCYVYVASLLAVLVGLWWLPLGGVVYHVTGWWRVPLYLLMATGALLTVLAAAAMSPLELAGVTQVRHARRSTLSKETPHGGISAAGPFGVVRHPIYFGWILMVCAAPLMTYDRLLFAAVSSGYLILAIPWEERSLAAVHGDSYRAYQRRVRWRVVPGLW